MDIYKDTQFYVEVIQYSFVLVCVKAPLICICSSVETTH
jgi:hypothetical protein